MDDSLGDIPDEDNCEIESSLNCKKTNASKKGEKEKSKKGNRKESNQSDVTMEEGYELESDEEKDEKDITIKDLSKIDKNTFKNLFVQKFIIKELTQEQLEQIFKLKEKTDEEIAKTVINKHSKSIVKALVSKKKNRFCYDGYDLDLTYITPRIIAMGFPSKSIEGIYRNPLDEVKKFFRKRHLDHYKVYNLCEEKTYADDLFQKQGYFPFKDHEAPPLNLMMPFCEDAKKYLDEDEKNIIAVHCKAGKGRTGTLIACLLMYMNVFKTSDECLQYYGLMRVANAKGVTIPSQIRYIKYFEKMLNENWKQPVEFIKRKIIKIKMFSRPLFSKGYAPSFAIKNNLKSYYSGKKKTISNSENKEAIYDFNIEPGFLVEGDVYIAFYKLGMFGKKTKIFKLWFNTNFIPEGGNIYEFKKKDIDKACKDKEGKYFISGFKIEVHFE
jgi:phosphatidylinositol-3,4,5-trisphosphate 3-phosphatase/dual-specificity protein phosphatase PTEN